VPGLIAAHDQFGRCPREEVLAPAIRLARDGFPVGPYLAWALTEHLAQVGTIEDIELARTFYPGGAPLSAGARLVQRELASCLEAIVELGADSLREGPIADAICATVVSSGGAMSRRDLREDHVVVGRPASTMFAGTKLYGPSLAQSGTGILFPALAEIDLAHLGANRSDAYVSELARGLQSAWIARRAASGVPESQPHTIHISAAAPDGGLAALTLTHGPWFGSDLMAAGTGIVLNGGANLFAPSSSGGRPVTNMTPLIVDGPDGARHAVGAAGGPRIPGMLLSTIVDVACFDKTLAEAISAPHLSVRAADGWIEAERGLSVHGASVIAPGDFGPVYGITLSGDRFLAAADARFESGVAPQ
jgi:gamma-glutamyltranspeptidase / glutathione hydrolase